MNMVVPDEFLEVFDGELSSDAEARIRIAAQLYASGEVSLAKGAGLAGLKRWEFENWLSRHGINNPWTEEDLKRELRFSKNLVSDAR